MVGSILYAATITRTNIAFAAALLSRTASKWSLEHVHAARHVLQYIRSTLDVCLIYNHSAGLRILLSYTDAEWGGCLDTGRSITGYVFSVFGGQVAWQSWRQPPTALSTLEAECMASSNAARQATWLRQLLSVLNINLV